MDDFVYHLRKHYLTDEQYQWQLAKLSPNEYHEYITTGIYPIEKPSLGSPERWHKFNIII